MAVGKAIITDVGITALQYASDHSTTIQPVFFKFSNQEYHDSGGNLDPSVTDIDGWYLKTITAYHEVNNDKIQFNCECPVSDSTSQCATVGLYSSGTKLLTLFSGPKTSGQSTIQFSSAGMTPDEYVDKILYVQEGNDKGFYRITGNTDEVITIDGIWSSTESVDIDIFDPILFMIAEPPSAIPSGIRQLVLIQLIYVNVSSITDFTYVPQDSLLDHGDTPGGYVANYRFKINQTADATIFVDDTLLNLNDVEGSNYDNLGGAMLSVRKDLSGTFLRKIIDWTGMTDDMVAVGLSGLDIDDHQVIFKSIDELLTYFFQRTFQWELDNDSGISTGYKEPMLISHYDCQIEFVWTRCTVGSGTLGIAINGIAPTGELTDLVFDSTMNDGNMTNGAGWVRHEMETPVLIDVMDTLQMDILTAVDSPRDLQVYLWVRIVGGWDYPSIPS